MSPNLVKYRFLVIIIVAYGGVKVFNIAYQAYMEYKNRPPEQILQEKNEKCLKYEEKYKTYIYEGLDNKVPHKVDFQIFYSPTLETCIGAYSIMNGGNGTYELYKDNGKISNYVDDTGYKYLDGKFILNKVKNNFEEIFSIVVDDKGVCSMDIPSNIHGYRCFSLTDAHSIREKEINLIKNDK